jgi:hypothetical protein
MTTSRTTNLLLGLIAICLFKIAFSSNATATSAITQVDLVAVRGQSLGGGGGVPVVPAYDLEPGGKLKPMPLPVYMAEKP